MSPVLLTPNYKLLRARHENKKDLRVGFDSPCLLLVVKMGIMYNQ